MTAKNSTKKSVHRLGYMTEYMTARRQGERDIGPMPSVKNQRRKNRGKRDVEYYMRTYFRHIYFNLFTEDQKQLIRMLVSGIEHFGWQSIAVERGGGKSTIARGVVTWAINYGLLKFILLINANKKNASDSLENIKYMYEQSPLLEEDFPEICYPVKCLGGAPQRAKMQASEGVRTKIEWSRDLIVMPDIPGSLAARAIIETRGIDGAIRGLNVFNTRPDYTILDDIETRESVYSATETNKRRQTIEQDVIGLGGPNKKMSITMLGTIYRKNSLCDEFTDRKRKPAWHGIRQRLLIKKPDNEEMWDKYVDMRKRGQIEGDKACIEAHKFYLKNRTEMDRGSLVSNPYRYQPPNEASTLEACYNLISDMEWTNFACEYQNDPPDNMESDISNVDIATVCKSLNYLERGVVPAWCEHLTACIDVGGRVIHWAVVAHKSNRQSAVIDYGTDSVHSPYAGALTSDENKGAVQEAIYTAIKQFSDWERENGWPMVNTGEVKHIDLGLIDSGWMPDPVYLFCRQSRGLWVPTKGFGAGSKNGKYRPVLTAKSGGKKHGNHWHSVRMTGSGINLYSLDSDFWKNSVHSGFMVTNELPGSISIFGDDPVRHQAFARQICAEKWTKEFIPGKGWKEGFAVTYRQNHWLDTMAGNLAAADMLGIRLGQEYNTQPVSRKIGRLRNIS